MANPQRYEHSQLYDYQLNRPFLPGVPGEGFLRKFADPVYAVLRGAGKMTLQQFHVLQPPQVYFLPQAGVQGMGGVQAGFIISQPLLDPSQLDNAPVD
jgi:hypothetical protein